MPLPLYPSPITTLRQRYGLTLESAGERLRLSERLMKVLEMRTHKVPPNIMELLEDAFSPPSPFRQISIWEALRAMDAPEERA